MKNNQKQGVLIGLGVVLLLGVIFAYFTFRESDTSQQDSLAETLETDNPEHVLSYTQEGEVTLYHRDTDAVVERINLTDLSTGKERVIEHTLEEGEEAPVDNTFGDFLRVPHIVIKGENSWRIQESLTPERDAQTMLDLVAEANGKTKLHPIYPGQVLYYLQEKDGSSPQDVVEEVQTAKEEAPEVKREVQTAKTHPHYVYFKAKDFKSLYAYNDIENTVYRIETTGVQLSTSVVTDLDGVVSEVEDFYVASDGAITYLHDTRSQLTYTKEDTTVAIETPDMVDTFFVDDNKVYYTHGEDLTIVDVDTEASTTLTIGDTVVDYFIAEDAIYFQSLFGSGKNQNVLVKFDKEDVHVDDLTILPSNQTTIATDMQDDAILLSQLVEIDEGQGDIVKEHALLPIAPNLTKGIYVRNVPFHETNTRARDYLYVKEGDTLTIHMVTTGDAIATLTLPADSAYMPLFKTESEITNETSD